MKREIDKGMDLSLCRTLTGADLKVGAKVLWGAGSAGDGPYGDVGTVTYVSRRGGLLFVIEWEDAALNTLSYDSTVGHVRLAPLFWLKGKPVYVGDKVYYCACFISVPREVVITGVHPHGEVTNGASFTCSIYGVSYGTDTYMEWDAPLVTKKGWINVYPGGNIGCLHSTKELADTGTRPDSRIDCVEITYRDKP